MYTGAEVCAAPHRGAQCGGSSSTVVPSTSGGVVVDLLGMDAARSGGGAAQATAAHIGGQVPNSQFYLPFHQDSARVTETNARSTKHIL